MKTITHGIYLGVQKSNSSHHQQKQREQFSSRTAEKSHETKQKRNYHNNV